MHELVMVKIRSQGSFRTSRRVWSALGLSAALILGFGACNDSPGGPSSGEVTSLTQNLASGRSLPIRVRDSGTGLGLQAQVEVRQKGASELLAVREVSTLAETQIAVPQGATELSISAPGHVALETHLEAGELLPTTVLLDPETPAPELAPEAIRAQVRDGLAMLHGHVMSASSGAPIEGATVRLVSAAQTSQTDARGYFVLQAPLAPTSEDKVPAADSLVIEKKGYKTFTLHHTVITKGATHFPIELEAGAGDSVKDDTHKILLAEQGRLPAPPPAPAAHTQPETAPVGTLISVTLKASIRLGTSCSCRTCSSVTVLSSQTYVKRGLNDEWIASWKIDSLRAGAVAYRSYGQYFAYHPISSKFDICDNTCCQVNDADTNTGSDQATTDTANAVVEKSGAVFEAEYAAENNNGSCGNGQTGSPSASWPCMADSTCTGSSYNGHGRGMCQWGTQRWATGGKDWVWIVNHYYNNNGSPSGARSASLGNH